MLTMLAMVAQQESENTSKRIKFSKSLNAEKGKVPNLVYGYDKIIGDYFNLNINPFEANVVRRIYQMYINEEYGASKIAKILNEEKNSYQQDVLRNYYQWQRRSKGFPDRRQN